MSLLKIGFSILQDVTLFDFDLLLRLTAYAALWVELQKQPGCCRSTPLTSHFRHDRYTWNRSRLRVLNINLNRVPVTEMHCSSTSTDLTTPHRPASTVRLPNPTTHREPEIPVNRAGTAVPPHAQQKQSCPSAPPVCQCRLEDLRTCARSIHKRRRRAPHRDISNAIQ